jgi:hypothetical protein
VPRRPLYLFGLGPLFFFGMFLLVALWASFAARASQATEAAPYAAAAALTPERINAWTEMVVNIALALIGGVCGAWGVWNAFWRAERKKDEEERKTSLLARIADNEKKITALETEVIALTEKLALASQDRDTYRAKLDEAIAALGQAAARNCPFAQESGEARCSGADAPLPLEARP